MGTLRGTTDHAGRVVNKVTLGRPVVVRDEQDDPTGLLLWSDARLPDGDIDSDGNITVDEVELG